MKTLDLGKIVRVVRPRALIQGGSFRYDTGPTATEQRSFLLAVMLHTSCLSEGIQTRMGCMVNDFGVEPPVRPKRTGVFVFPEPYLKILQNAGLRPDQVLLFYESTLRNRVTKDRGQGAPVAVKVHGETGVPIPICASIMGRFYTGLANQGFAQQIGFYVREPKKIRGDGSVDQACPWGPEKGAQRERSGYGLKLEVINYGVYPDGRILSMGLFEPER